MNPVAQIVVDVAQQPLNQLFAFLSKGGGHRRKALSRQRRPVCRGL